MRIRIIRNTRINTRTCVLQCAYWGLKYGRRVQLARRRANVASTQYFFMNFIGNRLFRLYMTRRRTTWTRRRVISASHRPKIYRTLADSMEAGMQTRPIRGCASRNFGNRREFDRGANCARFWRSSMSTWRPTSANWRSEVPA